jgi:ATP-dependent RNA helicase DeaD
MILFEELGLNKEVLKGIEELGFQSPTPIQKEVVGYLLEDSRDIIALAQTGTGKTAAFGLPICQLADTSFQKVQALVLAPTRELCVQISNEIRHYGKHIRGLKIEPVYGGESIEKQTRSIATPPQILVATPGRLTDFIKRKKIDLSHVRWLVLDEADEMLDMGFEEDIKFILGQTPTERRTCLFSATMSKEIRTVANNYMEDPIEIAVGKKNMGNESVDHHYYLTENRNRYAALKRLADLYPDIFGIVFCRTRRETKEVAEFLTRDGYNADALHGDLSQAQRDSVMKKFRDKNLNLLVATDVAARGLDVNSLTHVINYNLPDDSETYTHRSGRTGRAGKTGISIALCTKADRQKIYQIEKKIQREFVKMQLPDAKEVLQKQVINFVDRIVATEVNQEQIEPFMDEIISKIGHLSKEEIIKHFVSSEVNKLLSYYENAPDLNVQAGDDRRGSRNADGKGRSDRGERSDRGDRGGKKIRLEVNVGSNDGLNPARLLGILNESSGSNDLRVGKIEIGKRSSMFEVSPKDSDSLLKDFNGQFKNQRLDIQIATDQRSSSSSSSSSKRDFPGRRRRF